MMRAPTVRGFQRTPSAGIFRRAAGFSPLRLPNLAAWYDLGPTRQVGTTSDDIRIDASNRVSLIADRSGNSGTNCLCLNGAVGNHASAPDSVPLSITGDIDIRCDLAMDDWTPGVSTYFVSKWVTTGNQRAYVFGITTAGNLEFSWSTLGSDTIAKTSTAAVGFTDLARRWVRVTLDVNNGAAGNDVIFYTSTDGSTWTQLGTTVTTAGTTSIFDSTAVLNLGQLNGDTNRLAGRIYRAQIYNGINGTPAFDANFALAGKLVSSFTESSSNAATVTINSSGDLGARISGERDLVQLTASKQPIYTAATATTPAFITFDGSDDYMKAAAFSLSQPETVYFVGQQVSWTGTSDAIFDGNAASSMTLFQSVSSPNVALFAGSTAAGNGNWPIGSTAIASSVFNGASSSLRINRTTATTGNPGAANGGGFALGAVGSGAAQWANQRTNEVAVYAAAHDTATQDRFALYAGSKWRFSV